jgi:hypothetical protein
LSTTELPKQDPNDVLSLLSSVFFGLCTRIQKNRPQDQRNATPQEKKWRPIVRWTQFSEPEISLPLVQRWLHFSSQLKAHQIRL